MLAESSNADIAPTVMGDGAVSDKAEGDLSATIGSVASEAGVESFEGVLSRRANISRSLVEAASASDSIGGLVDDVELGVRRLGVDGILCGEGEVPRVVDGENQDFFFPFSSFPLDSLDVQAARLNPANVALAEGLVEVEVAEVAFKSPSDNLLPLFLNVSLIVDAESLMSFPANVTAVSVPD
jgi:hypothetical protein